MIWEAVQGAGALIGLATGTFVLWERLTKHQPTAFIVAIPYMGGQRDLYLRLTNPSDRPIVFLARTGTAKNVMAVATDSSLHSVVVATVMDRHEFVLNGKESKDLVLFKPSNFESMALTQKFGPSIEWRYAQSSWWPWPRKIRCSITKRNVKILLQENDQE